MGLISGALAVHCSFQGLYIAPHIAHFTSPRQSMSISLQVLYQIASNKIPTAVPIEAHAIVMGVRQKPRRCDMLSSWAGHFAPPTKHPWESLSRPMQSLWGSGGKRVGAMCYYHGRAILLPPPNVVLGHAAGLATARTPAASSAPAMNNMDCLRAARDARLAAVASSSSAV
ncbi:hypothetical protein B0H13DRAFT_2654871 [Mycena leptocephala]|nr:hypothetical protein B0H13DRAFT_2654871 [Mycena leptocephala]